MTGKQRLYFTDSDAFVRCLIIAIRKRTPHRHGVVDGNGLVFHNGKNSFKVGFIKIDFKGIPVFNPMITNGLLITIMQGGGLTDSEIINARKNPNVVILNVCHHETNGECLDTSKTEYDDASESAARAVLQFYGDDVPIPPNSTHGRFATAHEELRDCGRGFIDMMRPILGNRIIAWGVIAFAFVVFTLLLVVNLGELC